ncbi:MAG TPA: hypothetical protein VKF62_14425, partial [Planctomycetota bacterium]|nr:hypothetical protein [Planctomycetota bacterium]
SGFDPKIDAAKVQDWAVREGGLFGAGRASARHAAQFVGDVSLKLSFKVTTLDKVGPKETVIYLLLGGILDDRKGTFICSPEGTNLVRMKKSEMAGLSSTGSIPPVPPFGKVHEMKLEWKGGKLTASLAGKTSLEAAFTGAPEKPGQPPQTGGTVFLWLEGPVLARVDDVVVEGALDPAWVEASKKDWVAKQLLQALPIPSK